MQSVMKSLKTSSTATVNVLDLVGEPADINTYFKAEKLIKAAYGQNYPKEKFNILWSLTREDNWTNTRLISTVKWFIRTNIWKNWSPADFLNYSVDLHSYQWALAENLQTPGAMSRMEVYEWNGIPLYRYPDSTEIPLPKFEKRSNSNKIYKLEEPISEEERAKTSSIIRETITKLSKQKSI